EAPRPEAFDETGALVGENQPAAAGRERGSGRVCRRTFPSGSGRVRRAVGMWVTAVHETGSRGVLEPRWERNSQVSAQGSHLERLGIRFRFSLGTFGLLDGLREVAAREVGFH
ncbi:hypothetical protein, partial [Embleya hyalina]|uniref:hypothetical protein n=1 Tax=Embleya hyalina TaxID=516124 RepID=UPI001C3F51C1